MVLTLHYKCKRCSQEWEKTNTDDFKSAALDNCPQCGSVEVKVIDRTISVKGKSKLTPKSK